MFYEIFRIFGMLTGYPLQWLFFKTKTYYEDKTCKKWKKGAKLIVSNHFNVVDYILTAFQVFPRKLLGVASEIAYENPWTRIGVRFFGAIKANRKTCDMSFVDRAAEAIDRGHLVQIFPEAQNTPDGLMHDFKPSYIHIAARSNGKIQLVITDGNYGLFRRAHLMIGREIDLADYLTDDGAALTADEVNRLNAIVQAKAQELRARLDELKSSKRRRKK